MEQKKGVITVQAGVTVQRRWISAQVNNQRLYRHPWRALPWLLDHPCQSLSCHISSVAFMSSCQRGYAHLCSISTIPMWAVSASGVALGRQNTPEEHYEWLWLCGPGAECSLQLFAELLLLPVQICLCLGQMLQGQQSRNSQRTSQGVQLGSLPGPSDNSQLGQL